MKRVVLAFSVFLFAAGWGYAAHYGLFVGLNQYNILGAGALNYCVADATAMQSAFIGNGAGWNIGGCTLLTDTLATKANIRSAMAALASVAQAGDTVVYCHSGHGGDYDQSSAAYLLAYDDYYEHWDLAQDLSQFASGVHVVVIVDACYSGGLFEPLPSNQATSIEPPKTWNFAGDVQQAMREIRAQQISAFGAASVAGLIFPDDIGWMTACAFDQESFEHPSLGHGIFTDAILKGFTAATTDSNADDEITCLELFDYAVPLVTNSIYVPSGYRQTPQKLSAGILSSVAAALVDPFRDPWDSADDTYAGATVLVPSRDVQTNGVHQMTANKDVSDFFAIPVTAGVIYTFQSVETTPVDGGNSDVDAKLYRLKNGSLQLIREAFDISSGNLEFKMVFEASRTETVYLQVVPYFPSGTKLTYQLAYSIGGDADSFLTLANGTPYQLGNFVTWQQKKCRFVVPAYQTNLSISIESVYGDCDLYLAYGRIPTSSDYDYLSTQGGTRDSLSIPVPAAGEWFAMVWAYETVYVVEIQAAYSPGAAEVTGMETQVDEVTGELRFNVRVKGDAVATVPVYWTTNLVDGRWDLYTNIPATGGVVQFGTNQPQGIFTVGKPPE